MRIFIDQDSVLYPIDEVWTKMHNDENPHHNMTKHDWVEWDLSKHCNGCVRNIYDYLKNPQMYLSAEPMENCVEITEQWVNQGFELGLLTTGATVEAYTPKAIWHNKYFPHIKNIIMTQGKIKHWVIGDVLIDDNADNLKYFQGIKILYNQPWNKESNILRACNWNDVNRLVKTAISFFDTGYHYPFIQTVLEAQENVMKEYRT